MISTTENSSFPITGADAESSSATSATSAASSGIAARVDSTLNGERVHRVAQSAHGVVDRLAERAVPAVERLRTGLHDARDAVKVRADNLSVMQDEWLTECRASVREKPLTAVAIGVVAGMFLSRLLSSR